jgi:SAM-dependent methyltransferase
MSDSHWTQHHRNWARLGPPLRPNGEVAAAVRDLLSGHDECILLLGVTPELADVGADVTAVDRNPAMIANIWPGDTTARRAVAGDWLRLGFPDASFSAAIGDGSLNALGYPAGHQALHGELARVLRPGGRFVCRVFAAPRAGEPVEALREAALGGAIRGFNAFKWRLAMALVAASGDPNIAVVRILDAFDAMFADRDRLAQATGWECADIDTIDAYRGSTEIYSFPTKDQFLAIVPGAFAQARFVAAGSYELAERCPILVMDKA